MEWFDVLVTGAVALLGAFGGGSIVYIRETKRIKGAEAHKTTTDARSAEVDLAEKILEKYERGILARMDSGDAVRKKEFSDLEQKINNRFDIIEECDRKQNETLRDIVEYLNGGFQKFEENKRKKKS